MTAYYEAMEIVTNAAGRKRVETYAFTYSLVYKP